MGESDLDRGRTFASIVRYYRRLHKSAPDPSAEPYRATELGVWATSRAAHVFSFFRRIDLARFNLFLDLGSGDGIVTCIAALFTRSIGIEVDQGLCRLAQRAARELQLSERAGFICGDYLELPIWRSDCLYQYPDKPILVIERALRDWRGALLVYGPHFPPETFLPVSRLQCGREKLVLYRRRPLQAGEPEFNSNPTEGVMPRTI